MAQQIRAAWYERQRESDVLQVEMHGAIAGYASRGKGEPNARFRSLVVENVTVHGMRVYSMPEGGKAQKAMDCGTIVGSAVLRHA